MADTINRIGTRCTDLSACALLKTPALQIAADEGHVAVVQQVRRMRHPSDTKSCMWNGKQDYIISCVPALRSATIISPSSLHPRF